MRRLLLPVLPFLLLAACKDSVPDEKEAAVKLEVSFNFTAGCIRVLARDKDAPDKSELGEVPVLNREPSDRKVAIAVFRRENWSRTLEIISTAHEQSCAGKEVASNTQTVTLDAAGVQTLSVALSAVDADGDGYVPTAGGGTDCDDSAVNRSPGLTETCDGVDNDCVDGIDNGLPLNSYYLDGDRDGVGAGQAVSACVAPANHVLSGNDCDDSDTASRPGATETCDDKDNDCDSQVDEGLSVSTYFRDADGDGFGLLAMSVQKCRQPEGYVTNSTDCNDGSSAVNPNAQEVCNEVDDNCRNGTDEGYNKTWHRDADGDTFGHRTTTMSGCEQPVGYVRPTPVLDCDDGDAEVNPNAIEKCNGVDDNCVGGNDEPFTTGPTRKGATCGDPCSGVFVCNDAQDGTRCNAPTATNYYADADGDGDGASTATAQVVCTPTPPPGTANRNTDCDDADRHNRGNGTEVCDFRDNDCDNTPDDGNVCMGAGWKQLTDAAVTGRDWNTVAISKTSSTGYPVWIAGAGGALARRSSASESFTSFDGACGDTTWNAAWVHSDGSVYLAGNGGRVALHDGTTCSPPFTVAGNHNVTGITGFEEGGLILYSVDEGGQLYSWTPGSAPVLVDDNSNIYRDVHGFDLSRLVIGAQEAGGNQNPIIESYTGGMETSTMSMSIRPNFVSIRSIWMVSPTLAYAVGDSNVVLRWQEGLAWAALPPPANVSFTSVCAPDRSSVYVTDAVGVIRRYTGTQWVPQFTASGRLQDIALVSPTNIWAVGPGGRVIHFPELP